MELSLKHKNHHYEKLQKVIEEYRSNREKLVDIQTRTIHSFNEISNIVKSTPDELLNCVNAENVMKATSEFGIIENSSNLFYSDNERIAKDQTGIKKIEMENPSLAIVGQVKAGKSTFVNSLLKENIVRQAYDRCTARITKLTYSENNYVKLFSKTGEILKEKKLKKSRIPLEYLKLSDEERQKTSETEKIVKAGIKNSFLKNGIDIIDTPGLSELSSLSNLSKDLVKNILPVMIYIIDGRTSVTQTDISDLLELKDAVPNLQIIYFITKLDTDDLSESGITDPIKLAESKMETAFAKLQYSNFIPSTITHWSECSYFHGASLYAYMDYYKNIQTPETLFHFNMFRKFEEVLSDLLLLDFENKISESCNILLSFQTDILTKIIDRCRTLNDLTAEHIEQIDRMKRVEENIFEKVRQVASDSKDYLKNLLITKLNYESTTFSEKVQEINYPQYFAIPESGMVIDKTMIENCQKFIINFICLGIENTIKEFVEKELFQKYQREISQCMTSRMRFSMELEELKLWEKSPYTKCLKQLLMQSYKFNINPISSKYGKSVSVLKLLTTVLKSIKKSLWKTFRIDSMKGCIDVRSPKWKKKQAQNCLKKCDNILLAEEVCQSLNNEFELKHKSFIYALEKEKVIMNKRLNISDTIRQGIIKYSSDFTEHLTWTLAIKSHYLLNGIEEKEIIGSGMQGIVTRCVLNGNELAKKTLIPRESLLRVADEVYYSYLFEHYRLLPLIAISIEKTKLNDYQVSIFTPLMKTDVYHYLKNNTTVLRERLQIGLQTAEALQYLHNQKIMHRDLKPANILLDFNNNVHLADYGLCKWIILSRKTLAGTPLHMAPEIIQNVFYNNKVDIYAFGIFLWYLVEGKGNHPNFCVTEKYGVLWAAANNERPERLKEISDELWDFMNVCWHHNPDERPDIGYVIQKMQIFLKNC